MDYLSQILADPNQERTVTIKTKPGQSKAPAMPEAPLSSGSANLPQGVLDMLMGQQSQAAPQLPPGMLEAMMSAAAQGTAPSPMGIDPMAGQVPMDQFNPYGV